MLYQKLTNFYFKLMKENIPQGIAKSNMEKLLLSVRIFLASVKAMTKVLSCCKMKTSHPGSCQLNKIYVTVKTSHLYLYP